MSFWFPMTLPLSPKSVNTLSTGLVNSLDSSLLAGRILEEVVALHESIPRSCSTYRPAAGPTLLFCLLAARACLECKFPKTCGYFVSIMATSWYCVLHFLATWRSSSFLDFCYKSFQLLAAWGFYMFRYWWS